MGKFLQSVREGSGLTQEDTGRLFDLTKVVYGRYERGESRLDVRRLIVFCEIFGVNPIHFFVAAAPHLFGDSAAEAEKRAVIMQKIADMPNERVDILYQLLTSIDFMEKKASQD
nr:helix-turn-helix transcriptional regulator [Allorhizobium sonneratiae]